VSSSRFTLNTNREIEGEAPMMWRRLFPWDAVGTRAARPQHGVRGRDLGATRRRQRPGVEALEGRQLLAALTEFPLSSNQSAGAALTAGPDGNLWFPESQGAGEIAQITPAGVLTAFPLPANYSSPSALTVGHDNNLWFTDLFNTNGQTVPAIAQITPAGAITEYQTKSNDSSTSAPTVGPDNNLWFTESTPSSSGVPAASVVRATTAGAITEFLLPTTINVVSALTDGPDGNLWFAASNSTKSGASASIGRITPGGTVSEFALPSGYFGASALTTGPDNNLWFSNQTSSSTSSAMAGTVAIARITPAGTVSEYPLSSHVTSTSPLTVGPDGNLWFSEQGSFAAGSNSQSGFGFSSGGQIGQITPAGAITEFPLAPGYDVGNTSALTVGPDKDLYFTFSFGTASSFSPLPPLLGTGTPAAISIGRITASGSVVEFTGTVPPSAGSYTAFAPTVGSDGNLWFPDGSRIGRLDRALATLDQAIPPGVGADVTRSFAKKAAGLVLHFDEPMNSASAGTASFYSVATGVKKHHMTVYSKVVKIRRVTYDPTALTVTLMLVKSINTNNTQVTVHGGIMAANGVSTVGDASTTNFF
jgi:virginiamycin B lyase